MYLRRFGGGYTVTLRVDGDPQELQDVIALMNVAFPGITLKVYLTVLPKQRLWSAQYSETTLRGSLRLPKVTSCNFGRE